MRAAGAVRAGAGAARGPQGGQPAGAPGVRLVRPRRPPARVVVPDDDQRAVIAHAQGAGPLVVLGAPGTGKTTALVEAVVARVDRDGVPPDAILVLAASRIRAAALRDRIAARLSRTVREPASRTPHAYAFGLLRRVHVLEGDVPPRLISGPEQDLVLADLLAGHEAGAVAGPAWPAAVGPEVRVLRGFRDELRDLLMRAVERGLGAGGPGRPGPPPGPARLGQRRGDPRRIPRGHVPGHSRGVRPGGHRGRRRQSAHRRRGPARSGARTVVPRRRRRRPGGDRRHPAPARGAGRRGRRRRARGRSRRGHADLPRGSPVVPPGRGLVVASRRRRAGSHGRPAYGPPARPPAARGGRASGRADRHLRGSRAAAGTRAR